jgi:hypothetical protein
MLDETSEMSFPFASVPIAAQWVELGHTNWTKSPGRRSAGVDPGCTGAEAKAAPGPAKVAHRTMRAVPAAAAALSRCFFTGKPSSELMADPSKPVGGGVGNL